MALNASQTFAREMDFAVPDTLTVQSHQDQATAVSGSHERRRKQPNMAVLRLRSRGRSVKIKLKLAGSRAVLRGSNTVSKSLVARDIRLLKRPLPWHQATKYNLRLCFVSQNSSRSACRHRDFRARRERAAQQGNKLHNATLSLTQSSDELAVCALQSTFAQELKDATVDTGAATVGGLGSEDGGLVSTEHLPSLASTSSSDDIDNIFSVLDRN